MAAKLVRRGDKWTTRIQVQAFDNEQKRRFDKDRKPLKEQRRWSSRPGASKAQAEDALREHLTAIKSGNYVPPTDTTVSEWLDKWLSSIKADVTPKTWQRYEEIAVKHLSRGALGRIPLQELAASDVKTYMDNARKSAGRNGKGLAPRTLLHHYRVLCTALNVAVEDGKLSHNPIAGRKKIAPKVRKTVPTTLNADEIKELLQLTADTEFYLPCLLAVGAGLRRGEVLGLRWRDLRLKQGLLTVTQAVEQTRDPETRKPVLRIKEPKSGQGRSISLPAFLVAALQAEKDKLGDVVPLDALVVAPPADSGLIALVPDDFSRRFSRFIDRMKFAGRTSMPSIDFHSLRHTHATELFVLGTHPKIVQERLGHKDIKLTLDTYSHVIPSMQGEAAERLDIALA